MGRTLRVTAVLLSFAAAAWAQDTESVNAQNVFNVAGTIYNRSGTLLPLHFNQYGIPVPSNYTNPDVLLTLNSTTGGTGLGIYCNPGYGSFADPNGEAPGPNNAVWFSDLSTVANQVFISRNDPNYKSPTANDSTAPFFICSVINNDANTTTNYTLVANIIAANRTLVQSEQVLLNSLYSRCCPDNSSCAAWRSMNSGYVSANGGAINTDFCNFPNQICSPTGNLYRLNLASYNLTCSWPGDLLGQFAQLATLNLGSNPQLRGNTTAVSQTLRNLTSLQFLDLSGDTGITGALDSGTAATNLCAAAQANLVSISFRSIGLTGTIPSCLYSRGSSVIALDVGANNLTGSIQNTIPVNSSLQLLHVDLNQLTGALPASLANAVSLVDFDATSNRLTGTIPSAVGAIRTLQNFVVKMNNLSGPIPDAFGTAQNLQVFDAKQNALTTLPAAWMNASFNAANMSLVNVRVSLNRIQGVFPSGLMRAPQLTYLILNENNLTGELPSNSSMFQNLRALNVSTNQLGGRIPSAWSQSGIFSATPLYLTSGAVLQQVFDVSNNRFNGTLPDFLAYSAVPTWTRAGIFLQRNNLDVSCSNSTFNYITSLCPNGNQTTVSTQNVSATPPSTTPTARAPAATTLFPVTPPAPATTAATSTPPPQAAPRQASTTPTTVSTQSSEQQSSSSSGLSGGAIAGIVIGVLAGAALAVLLVLYALRRRGGRPPAGRPMPPTTFGPSGAATSNPVFDMPNDKFEVPPKEPPLKSQSSTRSQGGLKTAVSGLSTKHSAGLKNALSGLSTKNSGFERFEDAQADVELSPPHHTK